MGFLDVSPRADALRDFPGDIFGLCSIVQGLLIHDAAVFKLYGDPPADIEVDRETRPVIERIDVALSKSPLPLTTERAPFERQVGTCRDFAAILCAFARSVGFNARVRCGYAMYLGTDRPEDHWVVEYSEKPQGPWKLADPQMDKAHRDALEICFNHANVPRQQFISADEAWRLWRTNVSPADIFGHGKQRGERFLFVNLVRDALTRSDVLISSWDNWRELGDLSIPLPEEAKIMGDAVCSGDWLQLDHLAEVGSSYLFARDGG